MGPGSKVWNVAFWLLAGSFALRRERLQNQFERSTLVLGWDSVIPACGAGRFETRPYVGRVPFGCIAVVMGRWWFGLPLRLGIRMDGQD